MEDSFGWNSTSRRLGDSLGLKEYLDGRKGIEENDARHWEIAAFVPVGILSGEQSSIPPLNISTSTHARLRIFV